MGSTVELIVVLLPRDGKTARVKQLFSDLAQEAITHEKGCQKYDVYIQTKSKGIPSVILHEKYVDQDALDAHHREAHFKAAVGALEREDLLRVPLDVDEIFVERVAGHFEG